MPGQGASLALAPITDGRYGLFVYGGRHGERRQAEDALGVGAEDFSTWLGFFSGGAGSALQANWIMRLLFSYARRAKCVGLWFDGV